MAKKVDTLVTSLELDISGYKRSAAEVKRINESLQVGGGSFGGASVGGSSSAYKGAISGSGGGTGGSFAAIGAASLGIQRAQATKLSAIHASNQANHRVLQQILLAVKSSGSSSSSGMSTFIPRNRLGSIHSRKPLALFGSMIEDSVNSGDGMKLPDFKKKTVSVNVGKRVYGGAAVYMDAPVGPSDSFSRFSRPGRRGKQGGFIDLPDLQAIFAPAGKVLKQGFQEIINSLIGTVNTLSHPFGIKKIGMVGGAPHKTTGIGNLISAVGGSSIAGAGVMAFVGGITAGAAAMASLSKNAFDSYLEFDKMEASIGGALGSLTRGKEVMKELQNYAKTSSFSLKDIASASVTMSAGGMNLAQSLPLAEKFAQALGGTPQDLEQVSSALLKVQGGSFGEAMEIFRKAGVSTSALRGAGVNITQGGEVQSSSADFMKALEKLSGPGTAVGGLADAVKNSSATKISNAGDAVGQVLTKLGEGIKGSILPLFDKFTTALSNLVENGTIDMVAESFSNVINTLTENVDFGALFDNVASGLKIFADFLSEGLIPVVSTAYNAIKAVVGGIWTVIEWIAKIPGIGGLAKLAVDSKKYWIDDKVSQMDSGKTSPEYLANKKRMDAKKKKNVLDTSNSPNAQDGAEGKAGKKGGKTPFDIVSATQNAYLARIANATEKALDIQAMILGGGRLAAQGISPNDLTNHRNRARNGVRSDPMLAQLGLFVQTAIQNSNGY